MSLRFVLFFVLSFLLTGLHLLAQEEMSEEEKLLIVERKAAEGDTAAQYMLGMAYIESQYGLKKNVAMGIDWLVRASNQGCLEAHHSLGTFYILGENVSFDSEKAFVYFLRGAELGDPRAEHNAGMYYALRAKDSSDLREARRLLENAYSKGYTQSKLVLGVLYLDSIAGNLNVKKGIELVKESADEGDPKGCCIMYEVFRKGILIEKDYSISTAYCKKAAELGYEIAQYALAENYLDGINGFPVNLKEAIRWYSVVLDSSDNASSMYKLAKLGRGIDGKDADYEKAAYWLQRASELNHAYARDALGLLYLKGKGVPQNDAKAFEYFTLSAKSLYSDAIFHLAEMYENGRGTPIDKVQAFKLYSQASEKGNNKAKLALWRCYSFGIGTKKDLKRADKYKLWKDVEEVDEW